MPHTSNHRASLSFLLSQTGLLVHKPVRLVCVPECGISVRCIAGYAETQSDEGMAHGET